MAALKGKMGLVVKCLLKKTYLRKKKKTTGGGGEKNPEKETTEVCPVEIQSGVRVCRYVLQSPENQSKEGVSLQ